jgi:DNA-binding transcriptional LysR family regulator
MNEFLDTRLLRAFMAVAKHSSFTAAARDLSVTQSAISHTIRTLESELNCKLLLRQGRKVSLTHQGRELLKHGEALASLMGQMRSSVGGLDQNPRGMLRIGCTISASQFILPTALREFRESFPLYDIRVFPGETPETLNRLLAGEVDISISLNPGDTSQISSLTIFHDDLQWLVSPIHPLAGKKPNAKQASEQTFILSSRQGYTFELVQAYFLRNEIRPRNYMELGSMEAIKELAKLALGIGVCASWTAAEEIRTGQLVPLSIGKGAIRRHWVVSALKNRPLRLSERLFMGICRETGRNMAKHWSCG